MEVVFIILGVILLVLGLAGCVLPVIPGPPLSYVALLLIHFTGLAEFSYTQLGVWLLIVAVAQVLDFIVPAFGTKLTGGSANGKKGCMIGAILGLFFMPWGIVLGPFLGAVIGELMVGRSSGAALLSGLGSLVGFLLGTVLKVMVCLYFIYEFTAALV